MHGPCDDVPAFSGDPDDGATLVTRWSHVEAGDGDVVDLARAVLEVSAPPIETLVDSGLPVGARGAVQQIGGEKGRGAPVRLREPRVDQKRADGAEDTEKGSLGICVHRRRFCHNRRFDSAVLHNEVAVVARGVFPTIGRPRAGRAHSAVVRVRRRLHPCVLADDAVPLPHACIGLTQCEVRSDRVVGKVAQRRIGRVARAAVPHRDVVHGPWENDLFRAAKGLLGGRRIVQLVASTLLDEGDHALLEILPIFGRRVQVDVECRTENDVTRDRDDVAVAVRDVEGRRTTALGMGDPIARADANVDRPVHRRIYNAACVVDYVIGGPGVDVQEGLGGGIGRAVCLNDAYGVCRSGHLPLLN
eukprot:scaffold55405_cov68-Phaeocystis_antarctica.AAC.5